jgi:hypothetical protein
LSWRGRRPLDFSEPPVVPSFFFAIAEISFAFF